jgi:hypothetical protein
MRGEHSSREVPVLDLAWQYFNRRKSEMNDTDGLNNQDNIIWRLQEEFKMLENINKKLEQENKRYKEMLFEVLEKVQKIKDLEKVLEDKK